MSPFQSKVGIQENGWQRGTGQKSHIVKYEITREDTEEMTLQAFSSVGRTGKVLLLGHGST